MVLMLKYFIPKKRGTLDLDMEFYNSVDSILENYQIFKWYDDTRNFVTKKMEGEDKLKLNFENSTLAD